VEVDLGYDPDGFAGPVDKRALDWLITYRYHLDPAYLAHVRRHHGGIPRKGYFSTPGGATYRLGRFLTLFTDDHQLSPPPRPSWLWPGQDARLDYSAVTLMDQEGASCRNLFAGEELLPFAALYAGPHHPDGMDLADGNCDLVCFFYGDALTKQGKKRPSVVRWDAHAAQNEHFRWEDAFSGNEDEPVRYEDFIEAVATDFDAFLLVLREQP
jgi:hypothetical protein